MNLTEAARAQVEAAAERYRQTRQAREEVARRQQREHKLVVDTAEQVEARVNRLLRSGQIPMEAMITSLSEEAPARHTVLERIIDKTNDLQSVTFLSRGARIIPTTARISEDDHGRRVPIGTGFLVSPRLLMTNNHVLSDPEDAARLVAEFNCELDADGAPRAIAAYRLDPDTLFLTDRHLDYTLVALAPGTDGRAAGDEFGWNRLIREQGKIVTGESLNVVGHPMGRLKEIAIRNGVLQHQHEQFLQYTSDTERGSSGSAVYNDQWEVVALHHAGVPRTDDDGNWLKQDGTRWQRSDGDDAVDWIANEGARVSVMLDHILAQDVTAAQRQLLDEAFDGTALPTTGVTTPVTAAPVGHSPALTFPERAGRRRGRSGLAADGTPRDSGVQMVFLHGRGQEGKDPGALRRMWAAGLGRGLVLSGMQPVDARNVWFPYYGDAFIESIDRRERGVGTRTEAAPAEALAPADGQTRDLYETLIAEAAYRAGYPDVVEDAPDEGATEERFLDGVVSRLQKQLSWLAARSHLDEWLIAAVFRDVSAYLDRDDVRKVVLDTVLEHVPTSGKLVVVSHSLGTVVAMDLLTHLKREVEVVRLVTAGSPLGMNAVYDRLLTRGPERPARVGTWLNVWCAADAVAIGCPLTDDWGDQITEVVTDNPPDRAHAIDEYLADTRVARAIGRAL